VSVQLHEEAQRDIDKASLWYEEQEDGLGEEFLAEVHRRFTELAGQPDVWPVWPGSYAERYPVRRRLLHRFPYAIAYQTVGDTIVVVAVAADKQRPRYWSSRIER
jgi:plasmid stabilization system protein ParE